jgi:putative transposase
MMESFWGTMQLELLDRKAWKSRKELANAIFEWIECWYNPERRHSSLGMLSPADYETRLRPVPCQNSFMVLNWPFATAKPLSGIR